MAILWRVTLTGWLQEPLQASSISSASIASLDSDSVLIIWKMQRTPTYSYKVKQCALCKYFSLGKHVEIRFVIRLKYSRWPAPFSKYVVTQSYLSQKFWFPRNFQEIVTSHREEPCECVPLFSLFYFEERFQCISQYRGECNVHDKWSNVNDKTNNINYWILSSSLYPHQPRYYKSLNHHW